MKNSFQSNNNPFQQALGWLRAHKLWSTLGIFFVLPVAVMVVGTRINNWLDTAPPVEQATSAVESVETCAGKPSETQVIASRTSSTREVTLRDRAVLQTCADQQSMQVRIQNRDVRLVAASGNREHSMQPGSELALGENCVITFLGVFRFVDGDKAKFKLTSGA